MPPEVRIPGRAHRFRRWKVVTSAAAVLVVLAGAVVAVLAIRGEDSSSQKRRADLPAPAVDEARSTLSYLDGEGAALMRMHRTASNEPVKGGRQRCERVVQRLDARAPSARVAGLMDGVDDEPLRAALSEERLALGIALTRCLKNRRATPEDAARLRRATDLTRQRLGELQAAIR